MAKLKGIELLRNAVRAFDNNNEGFNLRFTARELLTLYEVWTACAWDFFPDQWTPFQVNAALDGYVPQWQETEREARPIELLEHGPWQDPFMYELLAEEWNEAQRHKY